MRLGIRTTHAPAAALFTVLCALFIGACEAGPEGGGSEEVGAAREDAKRKPGEIDCFPGCPEGSRIPPTSDKGVDNCKKLATILTNHNTPPWVANAPICLGLSEDIDKYIKDHTVGGKAPCNRLGLPKCDGTNGATCWSHCKNQLMMECIIAGHPSFGAPIFVTPSPIPPNRFVTAEEECLWRLCKGTQWKTPATKTSMASPGDPTVVALAAADAVADDGDTVTLTDADYADMSCPDYVVDSATADSGSDFDMAVPAVDPGTTCACDSADGGPASPPAPVPPADPGTTCVAPVQSPQPVAQPVVVAN